LGPREAEAAELRRVWERQHLSVLECCPKLYHDIVRWIVEGRGVVAVMNKIDEALDRTPTPAARVTAATAAFDQIRALVPADRRAQFVDLVGKVNRGQAAAPELKRFLYLLAVQLHAGTLLESTYFDDVRAMVERAG
jgi:hypothetical protein